MPLGRRQVPGEAHCMTTTIATSHSAGNMAVQEASHHKGHLDIAAPFIIAWAALFCLSQAIFIPSSANAIRSPSPRGRLCRCEDRPPIERGRFPAPRNRPYGKGARRPRHGGDWGRLASGKSVLATSTEVCLDRLLATSTGVPVLFAYCPGQPPGQVEMPSDNDRMALCTWAAGSVAPAANACPLVLYSRFGTCPGGWSKLRRTPEAPGILPRWHVPSTHRQLREPPLLHSIQPLSIILAGCRAVNSTLYPILQGW